MIDNAKPLLVRLLKALGVSWLLSAAIICPLYVLGVLKAPTLMWLSIGLLIGSTAALANVFLLAYCWSFVLSGHKQARFGVYGSFASLIFLGVAYYGLLAFEPAVVVGACIGLASPLIAGMVMAFYGRDRSIPG